MTAVTSSGAPDSRVPPSLATLFRTYFWVGATGFGGSIVWLRRILIEEKHWLTVDEFNDALALSQFLPGPNVFNLIVVLGKHFHGWRGIVTATVAIMIMPIFYAVFAVALYRRFGATAIAQNIMHGVAPVAAGLIVSLALKTATSNAMRGPLAIVAALTFLGVAFYRVSLPVILITMGPLGVAIAVAQAKWAMKRAHR